MRKRAWTTFVSVFCLTAAAGVLAEGTDDTAMLEAAQKVVENIVDTIKKMYPENAKLSPAQKIENEKYKTQIRQHLDMEHMSAFALGKHWAKRSELEKKDFTKSFGDLLIKNASSKSTSVDYQIKMKGREMNTEKHALVNTRILRKDIDPVNLQYELKKADNGEYRVVDLIIDEESSMKNYRDQFDEIITKKGGFPELMRRLNKMLKESSGKKTAQKSSSNKKG
jgi:ABC-type transporter MlaC component